MSSSSNVRPVHQDQDVDSVDEIWDSIHALRDQYRDNPVILAKLKLIVCSQLPLLLESLQLLREKRALRQEELQKLQDDFVEAFTAEHTLFWCAQTDLFFSLLTTAEVVISAEDDILYSILSTISNDHPSLMCWKQKTKNAIMKKIRENSVLANISFPGDAVSSAVNKLFYGGGGGDQYQEYFESPVDFVYFLVVVGDILHEPHQQHNHRILFISSLAKPLLLRLSAHCQCYFGVQIATHFKHSFHGPSFENCRIVPFLDIDEHARRRPATATATATATACVTDDEIKQPFLTELCLAAHLSTRYAGADAYLQLEEAVDLKPRCMFLATQSPLSMVVAFSEKYLVRHIIKGNNDVNNGKKVTMSLGWKHMYYLWKHFLRSVPLPSTTIMSKQKFREELIGVLHECYCAEDDIFERIHSPFLPVVELFMKFWDRHIVAVDEDDDDEGDEDDATTNVMSYSVEEIQKLFVKWNTSTTTPPPPQPTTPPPPFPSSSASATASCYCFYLGKKQILDIIKYYYPGVYVLGGRVHRIRCTLWDKHLDMQIFWSSVASCQTGNNSSKLHCLYAEYLKLPMESQFQMKVNWNYFKKSHAQFMAIRARPPMI